MYYVSTLCLPGGLPFTTNPANLQWMYFCQCNGCIYGKLNFDSTNDKKIDFPGKITSNILFILSIKHPKLAFIHP